MSYTLCPPMTALTSLLLTSPVPLGSAGEVIWLPPNFKVQVVSGGFVSAEKDSRAPGSGTELCHGKRQTKKFLKAQYCCALPHAVRSPCGASQHVDPRVREMHIPSWKTVSFIVIISSLRHRHYCSSSKLSPFPNYQQAVKGSSFLWKVKSN